MLDTMITMVTMVDGNLDKQTMVTMVLFFYKGGKVDLKGRLGKGI